MANRRPRVFSPKFNFTISERKVLLILMDHAIALGGIYLYFLWGGHSMEDLMVYISMGYFAVMNLILNGVFKTYTINIASKKRKLHIILFVYLVSFSIFFITPYIAPVLPKSRLFILYLVIFVPIVIVGCRWLYIKVIFQPVLYTNAIILGKPDAIVFLKENFDFDGHFHRIVSEREVDHAKKLKKSTIEAVEKLVKSKNVNVLILAYDELNKLPKDINNLVEYCSLNGIEVYDYLKYYEMFNYSIPLNRLDRNLFWYFPFTRSNYNLIYKGIHRLIDIGSALLGLFFLALILPFIVVLNLLFNRGPLFFKQKRVGKGGVEFELIKLRSMVIDAEKNGAQMATKNDARVTVFGKILRKLRLDELPQFWVVLKGDMSLIGPRPERKVFVDQLRETIPFYDLRHMIKPGITGWAQVKFRYAENLEDSYKKLEYDLFYIKNRSILLDFRIIIDTINTIIFSKGQ
jgi:exopolysaccharide biosynthesis polyprenyl glycosylphosphotransferase